MSDRIKQGDEKLADPTWYRIDYALAVEKLRAATQVVEFWAFGMDERVLLSGNRATEIGSFAEVEHAARLLVERASEVLDRIGWDYVARRPPWYRSWFKRFGAKLVHGWRRLRRKPPRRSFIGDWKLGRFLSRSVEPAAVLLLWSARVEQDRPPAIREKSDKCLPPLRRRRGRTGEDWLQRYLDELIVEQPRRAWYLRFLAWLGWSKLRSPERPTHRLQYNLACLFSRLAAHEKYDELRKDCLRRSADYLEHCLSEEAGVARGEARRRALTDPGLATLKERNPARWEAIVNSERFSPADVPAVGEGEAR